MTALQVVQVVVSLSFLALCLYTVLDWLQHRERSRGYLALALGTLGLTSILGQIDTLTGNVAAGVIAPLSLVLFMTSGYALLLFRDSFIPLSRSIRVGAAAACVLALVFYLAVAYPGNQSANPTPLQSLALVILVLVWSACVMEPVVRFWLASRRRPAVQRGRLRALAGGYAAIVFILLIAGLGGSAVRSPVVQWLFEAVALISLPLLLAAFNPPRWLRRLWAQSEVDELRGALHELVLFSPDRPTLAGRGLEWAIRLVGADGGAILDSTGAILAIKGMQEDAARRLAAQVAEKTPKLIATPGSSRENAMVLPLRMDAGTGALVVMSGPFTPFFGTDELIQVHAYATNVTAALDRARVTERLQALDRMKSQFLNLASHELRSPLGVISGYVSMLEQGSFGQLKEPGLRAVEIVKAKALEMNLLVAQMLDAARLEEGKLTLKRDNLDLRRIVDQAVTMVKPMASSADQLAVDSAADEVPVFGDPDRLLTIITNLTENAVKYSPDGSQVVLRVWSQDGSAKVSVSDTGVGIAPEDLPRLFNRFERLQHPQTRHVGGTGLGLYLSRELARQHGGDIEVNSVEGGGSTFTLVLPLTRPVPQSESAMPDFTPEVAPLPAPRLKVLSAEVEETRPA